MLSCDEWRASLCVLPTVHVKIAEQKNKVTACVNPKPFFSKRHALISEFFMFLFLMSEK